MNNNPNERKFPRVIKAYFTAAKWYGKDGEPWLADVGTMINISEGGLLLEVDKAPPFLSTLSLSLGFEDEIIKIEGEVARLVKKEDGKVELGIRFTNVTDDNREVIHRALLEEK
ncbi:hypothetical protein MNBD_NITROSPINAE02-1970 [hydrothermal vent metagenome]|uniref:PilZ domain-containing protein n=1 Tax=hydrothermal vent metagenome TaxID=652676 RepID=A0A3B1BY43_9ZZZZ